MRAKTLLFALCVAVSLPARATDYTDLWYNPDESGWGVNLVQSESFVFATFFVYAADGTPTWYTGELTWDGSNAFRGNLYATTGSGFASTWQAGNSKSTVAGTASFQPSSTNAWQGTLAWTVAGVGSASKAIERQTLTTIALGGAYSGGQTGYYSGCSPSSYNGSYIDRFDLAATQTTGGSATLSFTYESGLTCTLAGTLEAHGSLYRIPDATYKCSDGLSTTAVVHELKATSLGIEGRYAAPSVGSGCSENANFAAVLL